MLVARCVGSGWRDAATAALAARAEALEVSTCDAGPWLHQAASVIPVLVRPTGVAMTSSRLLAVWGESMPRPGPLPGALRQRRFEVVLVRIVPALSFPTRAPGANRTISWQGMPVAQVFEASSAFDGIRRHAGARDLIVLGARLGGFLDRLLYGGFPAAVAEATGRPVLVTGAAHD